MIKECKVAIQNSFSSVVLFDDVAVQIPTSSVIEGRAFVKYEDGKYFVVTKEDYEKSLKSNTEKKTKRIKAIDNIVNVAENVVIDNEDNM